MRKTIYDPERRVVTTINEGNEPPTVGEKFEKRRMTREELKAEFIRNIHNRTRAKTSQTRKEVQIKRPLA